MKGILMMIVITVCMFIFSLGLTKEIQHQITLAEDKTPGLYLYVFDREKEVWNRATIDDLKHATCKDLRIFPAHPMMTAKPMTVAKEA